MITIIITGPPGPIKSSIAKMFRKAMEKAGFVTFQIFTVTTSQRIALPVGEFEEH